MGWDASGIECDFEVRFATDGHLEPCGERLPRMSAESMFEFWKRADRLGWVTRQDPVTGKRSARCPECRNRRVPRVVGVLGERKTPPPLAA